MFPLLAWLQMWAGDLAMTELAVEIVLLPAGTQLNMSSTDVLVASSRQRLFNPLSLSNLRQDATVT